MIQKNDISEIRAELLLNFLYPEGGKLWIARGEGAFYRNYNYDLLSVDDETNEVSMARDGFLNLLPQGMITFKDDMKGEDAAEVYKKVQRRIRLLKEAFLPLDSFYFRQSVFIERQVAELLEDKLPYLLRNYFNIDLAKEPSPLVREVAVLLPLISKKRGDFEFVASLLGTLMHCEVTIQKCRYSESDTTRRWLPQVRFLLMIPGLSPSEYREKTAELQPLCEFIQEWFIPVEVKCEIAIKEHLSQRQPGERVTLGYNTEVKE